MTRFAAMAHERPAGEVLYAFLRDSGLLARLAATATAADEGLGNIARFFDLIRAQSASWPMTERCSSPGTCRP